MTAMIHIDEKSFQETISKGIVLVDFYADWCGPCRMLTPILDQLADEMKEKVVVAKLNVDEAQSIALKYDVTSVPTLMLFKDGKLVQTVVGLRDLQFLKTLVQKA